MIKVSPSTFTSSILTAVLAPSGTNAPVIVKTASDDFTLGGVAPPARLSPIIFSFAGYSLICSKSKVYPSIAHFGALGISK